MTVPCRNPVVYLIASLPLKHCIAELPLRAGLIVLCRCIRYSCIYEAHVSPALNESSEIWYFRCSNAIEICDGITVDSTWYCHIYFLSTNVTYIYQTFSDAYLKISNCVTKTSPCINRYMTLSSCPWTKFMPMLYYCIFYFYFFLRKKASCFHEQKTSFKLQKEI